MHRFTSSANRLSGQAAFKVLAKAKAMEAKGREILHFEIGEPDVLSPPHVVNAAKKALDDGFTQYVPSQGIPDLREAICDEVEKTRGFRPTRDQVLVMPGANPGIYYSVACLVEQSQNIVLQDPGFMTYYAVVDYTGIGANKVRVLEENNFRMDPDDVRKAIDDKTRLILMNSPQNPTGSVMTKQEIAEMAEIAEENNVYLVTDEIYSKLTYDYPHYTPSIRDECKERTILLDGFSKSYSMTGWRIGFLVGPEPVVEKMTLALQTIDSCTTSFVQKAAKAAITGPQDQVKRMRDDYKKRRDVIIKGLNEVDHISCVMPQGAFYAFPNIKKTGMTSMEFANYMLEEMGIAVLPGTGFGPGGEGFIRFSYATDMDTIKNAIDIMKEHMANFKPE